MTGARPPARIDQVFFGWNQSLGAQSVRADTFDDPDDHLRWLRRLKPHIRLEPMPGAGLPTSALSFFLFPDIDQAAVLRRVDTGATRGRNNSHALVGPSSVLHARIALGLANWPGWESEPPVAPQPLPAPLVVDEARRGIPALYPMAVANTATLVPIVAGLVSSPGSPISVIGCPEELKPAMIWALIDIARHTGTGPENPSFSTYEERHDDGTAELPHILFLPERPFSRGEVSRTIVYPNRPMPADAAAVQQAQLLCQQYADGTLAAAPKRQPVSDGTTRPAEPRPVPTVAAPSRPNRVAAVSAEEALVAALREARTLREFDHALADIQRRPPDQRRLLRAALDAKALDDAALRIEVTFREELLLRLARAAYGPDLEDLTSPQGAEHAVEVIRAGGSEQLAMIIGMAGRGHVSAAAFKRWAGNARAARPEPAARLLRRVRAARRSRYLPLAVAAAVVAILGVAFLGGVLLGRTGSDRPAVAARETPRPAPTVPLPRNLISGGYATIAGVKPSEVTVLAFARAGDTLRLQGPCLNASADIWFCGSRSDPAHASNADLVAYALPKGLAGNVLTAKVLPVPTKDWGDPYPIA